MKTFAELQTEDRRLVVLRLLAQSADYRASAPLIAQALPAFGHAVALDRLLVDLAWLAEQGLAQTQAVGGVTLAALTQRGADAGAGRAVVPGVKRPGPES